MQEDASVDAGWVVINTHPHAERRACENLERQGFQTYCPVLIKRIRHARREHDDRRPLFPGYVFAKVSRNLSRWRPVLSTIGVRNLVRNGQHLSFLDESFIQSLKKREVDGLIVQPHEPFRIGEAIEISGGPFDGLVGTIVGMSSKDRVTALINLLNGQVRIGLQHGAIRKI